MDGAHEFKRVPGRQVNECSGLLVCRGCPRDCQVSLTALSHQSVFSPSLVGSLGLTSGSPRRMWQHLRRVIDMSFLSGFAFPVGLTGVRSSPRKATRAVQSPEGCLVGTVRAQAGGSTSECQWARCPRGCALGWPPGRWLSFPTASSRGALGAPLVAPPHSVRLSWHRFEDILSSPCLASWGAPGCGVQVGSLACSWSGGMVWGVREGISRLRDESRVWRESCAEHARDVSVHVVGHGVSGHSMDRMSWGVRPRPILASSSSFSCGCYHHDPSPVTLWETQGGLGLLLWGWAGVMSGHVPGRSRWLCPCPREWDGGWGGTGSCEDVCPSLWEAQVRSCPAAPVTGLSDGLSCLLSDHQ